MKNFLLIISTFLMFNLSLSQTMDSARTVVDSLKTKEKKLILLLILAYRYDENELQQLWIVGRSKNYTSFWNMPYFQNSIKNWLKIIIIDIYTKYLKWWY